MRRLTTLAAAAGIAAASVVPAVARTAHVEVMARLEEAAALVAQLDLDG